MSKTPFDKVADHCLAAARELRGYVVSEDLDPDDPNLKFCLTHINKFMETAERFRPTKDEWPHKVIPFVPKGKTG